MKRIVRRTLNAFGYEIIKLPDIKQRTRFYADLYSEDSLINKRFYNIGAGGFSHPYWTNVDFISEWYARDRAKTMKGIQYDLFSLEPLPIDDESAEVVYSSHTVEHINNAAAQNTFNEAHRILKRGGFIRITTPNIDLDYRAYRENDWNYFYWVETYNPDNFAQIKYNIPLEEASLEQLFLSHFATAVSTLRSDGAPERIDDSEFNALFERMEYEDALDFCVSKCPVEIQKEYPGNHMNWWNFNKLSSMLREAGFEKIYLSGYGQSFCPILRDVTLFDSTHPKISIYVEAIK